MGPGLAATRTLRRALPKRGEVPTTLSPFPLKFSGDVTSAVLTLPPRISFEKRTASHKTRRMEAFSGNQTLELEKVSEGDAAPAHRALQGRSQALKPVSRDTADQRWDSGLLGSKYSLLLCSSEQRAGSST